MSNILPWHHRVMSKAEMNQDPIQGEFFKIDAPSEALEREDTQNRLDRKDPSVDAPVRIRYSFCEKQLALPLKKQHTI